MLTIENIKPNLDLLRLDDKEIYLVGTAHVSHASTELTEQTIRDIKPDTVCIELCDSRFESLKDPEKWKRTDIISVLRQKRMYVLMAQLVLAAFQKKLGAQLHIKPGAEMMRAAEVAKEVGSEIVLADRDIRTTLKRTWASISFFTSAKVLGAMIGSLFSDKQIDVQEIERLKSTDALEELMGEFSQKLPGVRTALIDERDIFLSQKIRQANGSKIVAIVGAGHIPGIKKFMAESIDLKPLMEIPPANKIGKIIGWGMLIAFIVILIWGFVHSGAAASYEMMKAWFWITGFSAAVGAALSIGHPLTVISAFLSAPFTTLHPLLASGWIAGLVEAYIRKPRVMDFETVLDDITTVKGVFRNRISKVLLVCILTNLTGTIGAFLGTWTIANML